MRPVVNAMVGPKKTISDTFSDVAEGVVDANNDGILCFSTEELLGTFERYNKQKKDKSTRNDNETIVASMDAVALFTSLDADMSAWILKEKTVRSTVDLDNIDTH